MHQDEDGDLTWQVLLTEDVCHASTVSVHAEDSALLYTSTARL